MDDVINEAKSRRAQRWAGGTYRRVSDWEAGRPLRRVPIAAVVVALATSPFALFFSMSDLARIAALNVVMASGVAAVSTWFEGYGWKLMSLDPSQRADVVRHVRRGTEATGEAIRSALVPYAERVIAHLKEQQDRGNRIGRTALPVTLLGFAAVTAIKDRSVGGTLFFLVPSVVLAVFVQWLGHHEREALSNAIKARTFVVGDAPVPIPRNPRAGGPTVSWRWVIKWFLVVVVALPLTVAAVALLARSITALF